MFIKIKRSNKSVTFFLGKAGTTTPFTPRTSTLFYYKTSDGDSGLNLINNNTQKG